MGIGAAWFFRRRRFFSGGDGGTLDLSGGCGGNSVLCIDGEWTRLAETWSEAVSSETRFATGLLGQDWSVILGNFLLNWSMVVADAMTSFQKM